MIRYPRRFRCRGPHLTPPDLRPKKHTFEWYALDIEMGGRSPEFDAMCRTFLGKEVTPEPGARYTVFSQVRQFIASHQRELGILEYKTWEAKGDSVQGCRVIKRPRLSPKLVATLPLLTQRALARQNP